jgi:hypothetical protein
LSDKPAFVVGAILAAFGVQLIGFGLIGEIIIFTQSPNLRDYKVEASCEGRVGPQTTAVLPVPAAAPAAPTQAEPPPAARGARRCTPARPLRVRELHPGEDARGTPT